MNSFVFPRQFNTKIRKSDKSLRLIFVIPVFDAAVGALKKELMMKRFLMVLAASTMVVSPMLTAQAQAAPYKTVQHKTVKKTVTNKNGKRVVTKKTTVRNNAPRYYDGKRHNSYQRNHKANYNANHKRWAKGQRFDRRYANNYRVIDNPRYYRLSNAPRGHQWVQSGNDAVLIAITSGIIGAVIGNAIGR